MARKEIMQSCISERQAQMFDLQKQIEQINTAYEKLEFEEDMYYHLKDNSSNYRDVYTQKQEEYSKKLEKIDSEKQELQDKMKILQREIDYISNRLN